MNKALLLSLSIVVANIPGISLATPIVTTTYTKLDLYSEVSAKIAGGEYFKYSEQVKLKSFDSTHSATKYQSVYDYDFDEPLVLEADANATVMGSGYYSIWTNAEVMWYPGDLFDKYGPPLSIDYSTAAVLARASTKSIFKVSGGDVDFHAVVVNGEGHANNSYGKFDLWDLTTAQHVLSLEDSGGTWIDEGDITLLDGHLYKLLATSRNATGGDEEIYVDYSFEGATVTVPEPTTLILFGAGLLGLGVTRRRMRA